MWFVILPTVLYMIAFGILAVLYALVADPATSAA
jgi:hypothetical protein